MKRFLALVNRSATTAPELLERHLAYIQGLLATGHLQLSGPFAEGVGGAFVFTAHDRAAAEAVVAADPLLDDPAAQISLHEWMIRFERTPEQGT